MKCEVLVTLKNTHTQITISVAAVVIAALRVELPGLICHASWCVCVCSIDQKIQNKFHPLL